jgi:hypothetical protein
LQTYLQILVEEKEGLLKSVFGLSKQLGRVIFPNVVKQSTGFDVIPINLRDSSDKDLIDKLNGILKRFLKTSISVHSRYEGKRVNEVGRRIEETLVNEMNKLPLATRRLGKTGYPDIEISYLSKITYLEIKTSSVTGKTGFRYFYYTVGTKIKTDARHVLLNVAVTEESPRYWKVDNWILSDLSKLSVRLKNEFNASKNDLMDEKARIISSL